MKTSIWRPLLYNRYEVKRVHPYHLLDTKTEELLKPAGVTSITGMFAKEAIPQWAANIASQTAIDLYGTVDNKELHEIARKRYIELRDDAGAGGKEGHSWIEDYLADKLEDEYFFESEHGIQFVEAYLEFEKDDGIWEGHSETLLFSEKYFYCGTRDRLDKKNGVYRTLDFKTGAPDFEYNQRTKTYSGRVRPYAEHFMQDAGYDIAESEEKGRISDIYALVYLVKNPKELAKKYGIKPRKYFYFETDNTPYWRDRFLEARSLFDISKNNPYKELE